MNFELITNSIIKAIPTMTIAELVELADMLMDNTMPSQNRARLNGVLNAWLLESGKAGEFTDMQRELRFANR